MVAVNHVTLKISVSNKYYIVSVCLIVSIITHILLPISLEAYEKFFSALVSGTYTDFPIKDYDTEVHFLLFSLYAIINKIFPNVQVYGYVVIIYNVVSLLLFGFILFHMLNKRLTGIKLKIIFPFLFFIISTYQIVNLSTTRIVIITCSSLFYLIHFELIKVKYSNLLLIVLFTFLSLIRIDATLLASLIFLLISFFIKKLHFKQFIPFIVSFSVFISFNVMMQISNREAKKVYYYRELDLVDRSNIDFANLSQKDSLYVTLLTNHSIMDVNHLKLGYVNKILKTKSSTFLNSLLNIELFKNTLQNSMHDILYAKWLIALCLAVIIGVLFFKKLVMRHVFLLFLLLILPFFLCLYVALPLRFIEPYYVMYTMFLVLNFLDIKLVYFTILLLCNLSLSNIKICKIKYDYTNQNFLSDYNYLVSNSSKDKPLVIEGIITGYFFSPNPIFNYKHANAVFLNFMFFNSYECYMDSWRKICNCNPLSLVEKLESISNQNLTFISNDETVNVYKKYLKLCWQKDIDFIKTEEISKGMNAYKVIFYSKLK